MTLDRALLARYFRQLADLGIDEVYLDGMTSTEALALLAGTATPRAEPKRAAKSRSNAAPNVESATSHTGSAQAESSASVRALTVLGQEAAGCTRCRLAETRTNVVYGRGSATADLVVVGEAPGQEEDRTGLPFVGRAGKLLDLLLMSIGLASDSVYICNVLKCRPPQNRNPLPDEVEACASHLQGQLDAIAPKVMLAVGKFAVASLARSDEAIGRLRGSILEYRGTPLVVTYHPAYLLRSPQMMRTAWQDFQLVRRILDEQA
jgi:DNA polymerase